MIHIALVVEGHGEVQAVKKLVQRYFEKRRSQVRVLNPEKAKGRGNITRDRGIERFLQAAATKCRSKAAILVVLDAENEPCPGVFAGRLAARAKLCKLPYPVAIVVAMRTFEAWILASIETIASAGICSLQRNTRPPSNPETVQDPKKWLERRMKSPPYKETKHQAIMTEELDFSLASKNSRSFCQLTKALDRLVQVAVAPSPPRGFVMPTITR